MNHNSRCILKLAASNTSSTGVEEKNPYDKVEYANQLITDDRPDPHQGVTTGIS